MSWFSKLKNKIEEKVNKSVATVKKDIKKVAEVAKKDINKAKELAKNVASKVLKVIKNTALLPILPLIPAMKAIMKKRGVSTRGALDDIVIRFYNEVVIKTAGFENLEAFNDAKAERLIYAHLEEALENNFKYYNLENADDAPTDATPTDATTTTTTDSNTNIGSGQVGATSAKGDGKKEFDKAGLLGSAGGAAAGMAIGLPPQAGAAVGASLEKIIKAIVAFFKKKKDDKDVKEALDANPPTDASAKQALNDGTLDDTNTTGKKWDFKKIFILIAILITAGFFIKKAIKKG